MTTFSTHTTLPYPNPYLDYKPDPQLTWGYSHHHHHIQQPVFDPSTSGSLDDSLPPESLPQPSVASAASSGKKRARGKGSSKSGSYKHVPHREKPPHLVARRNARERRRVQAVNTAFSRLRKCVPAENKSKRLSKVKTLHRAIEYIQMLQEMLNEEGENNVGGSGDHHMGLLGTNNPDSTLNKENELHQRWLQLPSSWGDEDEDDNQNSCLSFYDDFGDAM
ncbi:hypothetical protein JTE90_005722 [Oedothorax gibbosus]|uniref:BHLH domain-containing protein n=1 Tax=Oedothorax gibbosus TaxID=931172 RepID=A0AAV6UNC9_9ARAC|nr:hypothetical protein JTE90_005722 [Oedothorax gibbosus]